MAVGLVAAVLILYNFPVCSEAEGSWQWATKAVADFGVHGRIEFEQYTESDPVQVNVELENLQHALVYHIHKSRVGAGKTNCAEAGGHYNPTGKDYPCLDNNDINNCEAGDLSGKHKFIDPTETSFEDGYADNTITLIGEDSLVDRRSVVIHQYDEATGNQQPRYICANIVKVKGLRRGGGGGETEREEIVRGLDIRHEVIILAVVLLILVTCLIMVCLPVYLVDLKR